MLRLLVVGSASLKGAQILDMTFTMLYLFWVIDFEGLWDLVSMSWSGSRAWKSHTWTEPQAVGQYSSSQEIWRLWGLDSSLVSDYYFLLFFVSLSSWFGSGS